MPARKKVHEPFNLKDDKLPTASSDEGWQLVGRPTMDLQTTKVALGSGALKTEHSVNNMSETPKHIAIITVASSGLGLEFVRQLDVRSSVTRADVGVHHIDEFWLVARNTAKLEAIAADLRTPARAVSADLSKQEDIDRIEADLGEANGVVTYLVNCAGFGRFGSWKDIANDDATAMIDLDARAVVALTRACLPHMERGSRIIEVASAAAFYPLPYMNVYAASKAFVLRYTRALRWELHGSGITVTALCPTWVKTGFEAQARKSKDAHAVNHLLFAQNASTVVSRALFMNRMHAAVACCSIPSFCLRIIGKIVPNCITMWGWNLIRRL